MSAKRLITKRRREVVEAVRVAAVDVLAAEDYAQAYFAWRKLGRAIGALDVHLRQTTSWKGAA